MKRNTTRWRCQRVKNSIYVLLRAAWRSSSLKRKYCATASRTDKDEEEVNEDEGKGRTEMQKSRWSSPHFPFYGVQTVDESKLLP